MRRYNSLLDLVRRSSDAAENPQNVILLVGKLRVENGFLRKHVGKTGDDVVVRLDSPNEQRLAD